MENPYAIELPNVRRMLIPDDGFLLIEADLSRADAQVVAWDSGCEELKTIFGFGTDVHASNASWIYNTPDVYALHINGESYRQNAKRAVHLTHYAGRANTLAASLAIDTTTAERFIRYWAWERFPEIHKWHERIEHLLRSQKYPVIKNAFGYRRMYTDRFSDHQIAQALAWIGQGTVACVINRALLQLSEGPASPSSNWGVQLLGLAQSDPLLQVHDSIVMQAPVEVFPAVCEPILKAMAVTIPYEDPLIIPSELKWSDKSWGEMKSWKH